MWVRYARRSATVGRPQDGQPGLRRHRRLLCADFRRSPGRERKRGNTASGYVHGRGHPAILQTDKLSDCVGVGNAPHQDFFSKKLKRRQIKWELKRRQMYGCRCNDRGKHSDEAVKRARLIRRVLDGGEGTSYLESSHPALVQMSLTVMPCYLCSRWNKSRAPRRHVLSFFEVLENCSSSNDYLRSGEY